MRIKSAFRFALYAAFALLFASGAVWLLADQLKDGPESEMWQQVAASALMAHGGAAMITLTLFGALFPMHIQRAWRANKNRATGTASVVFNAILVASAFGLYYLGSEALRPWISGVHIAFGLAIPILILAHIQVGRRSVAAASRASLATTPMPKPSLVTLVPADAPGEHVPVGTEALAVVPEHAAAKRRAAR